MENTKGEVTVTGVEGGVTVVCLVMESLGWHLKVFQLNTTPRKKNAQWALHDQLQQH